MPNMMYCRFENTYNDLKECLQALEYEEELSESEQKYKDKLCSTISEYFDEDRDGHYEDTFDDFK